MLFTYLMRKIGQNRVILLLFLKLSDISHKLCIFDTPKCCVVRFVRPIKILCTQFSLYILYLRVRACVYMRMYICACKSIDMRWIW